MSTPVINNAVFAVTADGTRYRVTREFPTYERALSEYTELDAKLRNYNSMGYPCRISDSQVEFFNVRAMNDTEWATAPYHVDHGSIQWGFQSSDYAPGGSQWQVAKAIRLSETQQDELAYAAEHGHLRYSVHHKCYNKLAEMKLISYAGKGANLTTLGEAVAARAYQFINGATVAEVRAVREREAQRQQDARLARIKDITERATALTMFLNSELTIGGLPAPEALVNNDYNSPVYCANASQEGHYKITLTELEALVRRLVEEF